MVYLQFNEHKNLNMNLTDIKSLRMKQSHFKIQELLVKEEKILFILYIRKVFLKIDENSSIAT